MDDKTNRTSGTTSATTDNVKHFAGSGTVESAEVICGCPEPGPEKIEVEQVLGAEMAQKVVEFDMFVPPQKPDIEQVIDVYVKDLDITSVDVIPDKVIVRGELEVKVMYVADLPTQPVHAFEKDNIRWTRDIEVDAAQPAMKATADVVVEYVDYDFCDDDPRKVHITIVLKVWTRVVTTTELDVYALTPIDQVGDHEVTSASASEALSSGPSSSQHMAGYGVDNVLVTGPGLEPTAGTNMAVAGTAVVTANKVNVRTGPGTNFPVATQVNKDDRVTLKDQAFGWYRVVLADGNTTGWIAGWLLSVGTPKG